MKRARLSLSAKRSLGILCIGTLFCLIAPLAAQAKPATTPGNSANSNGNKNSSSSSSTPTSSSSSSSSSSSTTSSSSSTTSPSTTSSGSSSSTTSPTSSSSSSSTPASTTSSTTTTSSSPSTTTSSPTTTSSSTTTTAPTFQSAFSILLSPQYGSTENTGASAKLNFSFAQQGDNVLLNLDMTNTTNGKLGLGATASTLVGVAFDMPSFLNFSLTPSGSNFTQLWKNVNLSPTNQFGTYTAGISTPRNSFEGGNANGGLKAGESTTVSFLLSGGKLNVQDVQNSFLTGFSSGGFKVAGRFQQVNAGGGSDKVVGKIQIPETPKPKKVPEPGLGLGLAVVGGGTLYRNIRRRKVTI